MEVKSVCCPNCGASIDIGHAHTAYCEYCGSKIVNDKKGGKAHELYERAISEFKFGQFSKCGMTLYKALRLDPKNSDLLLMDATIKNDHHLLAQVKKKALSKEVIALCKREFDKRDINIQYSLNANDIRKIKIHELQKLQIDKINLAENEMMQNYLAFAKLLLPEDAYRSKAEAIEIDNNDRYRPLAANVKKWKRIFKRRFWSSMAWFALTLLIFLTTPSDVSVVIGTLFGLIGLGMFIFRKYHTDRLF